MWNITVELVSLFRFLYWRVCCFVCTREPRRQQSRRPRRGISEQYRPSHRPSTKTNQSMRRSVRTSQRTADSGYDPSNDPSMHHAYSDTDLRYRLVNRSSPIRIDYIGNILLQYFKIQF